MGRLGSRIPDSLTTDGARPKPGRQFSGSRRGRSRRIAPATALNLQSDCTVDVAQRAGIHHLSFIIFYKVFALAGESDYVADELSEEEAFT